ncbi:MAG: chemotaxis-specific protein-glutamate methyltransferase CheB [Chloroflexi bacterium]|nr:chemotaxis-specific protein-glutamate methyltransferase CheB [Chloroflexota bacterium]
MIRVLVVDDSAVVRELLAYILSSDPEIEVAAIVPDGEAALEAVQRHKPDVVTMDIHMPRKNGFEATRQIMETHPTPIVIVSGSSSIDEVATTFHAMEAGALAVVPRPPGLGHPDHKALARELTQTVKLMSEVKVVRRWERARRAASPPPVQVGPSADEVRLVVIGASTGGPVALQTILADLPADFRVPIVIVQHIAAGFVQGFVEWLAQASGRPVRVAVHGARLQPGMAYVGPDGVHVTVDGEGRIALVEGQPMNGLCPSASILLRSAAAFGPRAVGVLLTGMGKDGAEELRLMKENGAITIAQDKESSVIHGMPGEAIRLGGATYELPPEGIAAALAALVKQK